MNSRSRSRLRCLPWRAAALLACSLAANSPAVAQSRGELLYRTHCIACHTTEMHWRDQRAAKDWDSLNGLVRRWQGVASLGWSDADVVEVSRYLNDSIYGFDRVEKVAGVRAGAARRPG